ncbi:cupin domain-containing protein [Actinoplanes sp. NPDC048796]|uniref:cupin domain-containing protein n=1 Tax=Actinoplanes sp. NPDC048796 TaxID=3155640 RepID=UPI0033F1367C
MFYVPSGALHTVEVIGDEFDVEAMSAPVASSEGWAKTARKQFWPVLDNVAMYSLKIADSGMREPHWHPETAEMGYIAQGTGRTTSRCPATSATARP